MIRLVIAEYFLFWALCIMPESDERDSLQRFLDNYVRAISHA